MMVKIKKMLTKSVDATVLRRVNNSIGKSFRSKMVRLGINPNEKIEGEDDYLELWKGFGVKTEPFSYRFFSRYCGPDPRIVPECIGSRFVEKALNPIRFQYYYEDKNVYDSLFGNGTCAQTVLRRMQGGSLLGEDYQPVDFSGVGLNGLLCDCVGGGNSLILKPSVDSGSGKGVMKFIYDGKSWTSIGSNVVLCEDYLLGYSRDFVLQESIKQCPSLAYFNASSVNTLRIATYRSVVDESIHIVGAFVRMGMKGSFLDNAHAGGVFCGVDIETGRLNNYVCDQHGLKSDTWQGVVFRDQHLTVPVWNKVKDFVCNISSQLRHSRLVALDIAIDEDERPRLIEYNLTGFGFWAFMLSGRTCFGNYTEEIINYARKRKDDEKHFLLL